MSDFITPPGHQKFQAKMLMNNVNACLVDSALAYVEPGGGGPEPAHTHAKDHIFIVVDGCATIRMGGQTVVLHTDEAVYVKGNIEHSIWNEADQMLKVIKINCLSAQSPGSSEL
jgi:mannose-6-phosphate isomerase-like protein (cupin superfamily)